MVAHALTIVSDSLHVVCRHWVVFFTGGSISLYVYLYAIYYFFAKTKFTCRKIDAVFCRMYGFFQTSFYFGYTAVICFGLFMICGAVGYMAADYFVRKIYSTIKID